MGSSGGVWRSLGKGAGGEDESVCASSHTTPASSGQTQFSGQGDKLFPKKVRQDRGPSPRRPPATRGASAFRPDRAPRLHACPTMQAMEAAFFDLDKTIISRSSSLALTRPMYRAGLVSRSMLLKGAYAQFVYLLMGADERKMDRAKAGMLALSKGWEKAQGEELVRDVLVNLIDPYVYQEALDLIAL